MIKNYLHASIYSYSCSHLVIDVNIDNVSPNTLPPSSDILYLECANYFYFFFLSPMPFLAYFYWTKIYINSLWGTGITMWQQCTVMTVGNVREWSLNGPQNTSPMSCYGGIICPGAGSLCIAVVDHVVNIIWSSRNPVKISHI